MTLPKVSQNILGHDNIHRYSYHKVASNQHRLSFDIPDMDSQVEESKST